MRRTFPWIRAERAVPTGPIPKRRILFVRHGETDWNAERRMQGQRNIPLNSTGEDQARNVGQILPKLLNSAETPDLWCSPLMRCVRTFELAAQQYSSATGSTLPTPHYDDRLKEITFGPMEGKKLDELPPEQAQARANDHWGFKVDGAESYADGSVRAAHWLAEQTGSGSTLLIFSHGGICRGLRHHLLELPGEEAAGSAIPQGVVIEWTCDTKGYWQEQIYGQSL
ncbi:MAG: histidine phosphatase family protein [Pseudomonadota bacterium]